MANEINATNINEAAEAYVKTAYKEQYEVERLGLVMSQDKWNGYDLLDAFKAGVEWARQNPEYKPMLVEYEDETVSGQHCELCSFHNITNAETCSSLFEKRFGGKCTIYALRFVDNSLT